MVHALQETWRVLRKNGLLIDLRPLHVDMTIEAVIDEESNLIRRFTDDYRDGNDKASDMAIAQVIDENLFQLEQSASFVYEKFYDTGDELLEYYAQRHPPMNQPDDVVEKIKRANNNPATTLRVVNPMHLRTYRRIDPHRS